MQIEINKGECLHAKLTWTDEAGPIDLTGRTLSIVEAQPASLLAGSVTVTDALAGLAELDLDTATAASLGAGRTNWLRLGMTLDGTCIDTTPRIWIAVA